MPPHASPPLLAATRGAAAFPRALAVAALLLAGLGLAAPVEGASPALHHGPRSKRVVALTFDDGWANESVARILAILRAERVKATFFPISSWVARHPAVWRRAAADGHAIGSHTVTHAALEKLCGSALARELVGSSRTIERVTGRPTSPYLRPPFGTYDADVRRAAEAAGYRALVLWDVDASDWADRPVAAVVRDATAGKNGSIVVLHTLPRTVRALPAIIRSYKRRGFRFVTVPQLLDGRTTRPAPGAADSRGCARGVPAVARRAPLRRKPSPVRVTAPAPRAAPVPPAAPPAPASAGARWRARPPGAMYAA